jgi:excisionase family DNA binding protein
MTADAPTSPVARERLLYSAEEAAGLLGIGRTYMFALLASGEISSLKIGKRRKITRDALYEFIQRLRSEQETGILGRVVMRCTCSARLSWHLFASYSSSGSPPSSHLR